MQRFVELIFAPNNSVKIPVPPGVRGVRAQVSAGHEIVSLDAQGGAWAANAEIPPGVYRVVRKRVAPPVVVEIGSDGDTIAGSEPHNGDDEYRKRRRRVHSYSENEWSAEQMRCLFDLACGDDYHTKRGLLSWKHLVPMFNGRIGSDLSEAKIKSRWKEMCTAAAGNGAPDAVAVARQVVEEAERVERDQDDCRECQSNVRRGGGCEFCSKVHHKSCPADCIGRSHSQFSTLNPFWMQFSCLRVAVALFHMDIWKDGAESAVTSDEFDAVKKARTLFRPCTLFLLSRLRIKVREQLSLAAARRREQPLRLDGAAAAVDDDESSVRRSFYYCRPSAHWLFGQKWIIQLEEVAALLADNVPQFQRQGADGTRAATVYLQEKLQTLVEDRDYVRRSTSIAMIRAGEGDSCSADEKPPDRKLLFVWFPATMVMKLLREFPPCDSIDRQLKQAEKLANDTSEMPPLRSSPSPPPSPLHDAAAADAYEPADRDEHAANNNNDESSVRIGYRWCTPPLHWLYAKTLIIQLEDAAAMFVFCVPQFQRAHPRTIGRLRAATAYLQEKLQTLVEDKDFVRRSTSMDMIDAGEDDSCSDREKPSNRRCPYVWFPYVTVARLLREFPPCDSINKQLREIERLAK